MGAYWNNRPNRNYMACMVANGPTRSMGHTLDPHQTQGLTIKHLACLVSDTIKRRKVEMSDIYIEVEYYYLRTNRIYEDHEVSPLSSVLSPQSSVLNPA